LIRAFIKNENILQERWIAGSADEFT
jgi:hypothetical protein